MDFTQYQPVTAHAFQPVPIQPKERSYIHQSLPAHPSLNAPLSISIPASHLDQPPLPKTNTHPLLSSSAFKAWEPNARHVQRQTSAPGHTNSSSSTIHSSARRHGYSTRRQESIENMPDLFIQPYRGVHSGAGQGHGQQVHGHHLSQSSYYQQARQKSFSTHSTTEVTVWVSPLCCSFAQEKNKWESGRVGNKWVRNSETGGTGGMKFLKKEERIR